MLKNILKLKGVQELNKAEQKTIAGGNRICYDYDYDCLRRCQRGGGGRACLTRCSTGQYICPR